MTPKRALCLLLLIAAPLLLAAQKVLQIERYGSPKTQKIYIGDPLYFQLKSDDYFRLAYIEDMRPQDSLLVLADRYVNIYDIAALRYERSWPRAAGYSFFLFGAGWSGIAAIGYATDRNPDTSYRWADAIVTLSSWSLAFALPKLFANKTIKLGDRRRLRLLDLDFVERPRPF